jgi:hypothetical protein
MQIVQSVYRDVHVMYTVHVLVLYICVVDYFFQDLFFLITENTLPVLLLILQTDEVQNLATQPKLKKVS